MAARRRGPAGASRRAVRGLLVRCPPAGPRAGADTGMRARARPRESDRQDNPRGRDPLVHRRALDLRREGGWTPGLRQAAARLVRLERSRGRRGDWPTRGRGNPAPAAGRGAAPARDCRRAGAAARGRVQRLHGALSEPYGFGRILGQAPSLREALERAARVAPGETPVLLTGESGTGKELVAQAIHYASRRADGPCVAINCAALPEALIESELFGHERGAFTGADRQKPGRCASAARTWCSSPRNSSAAWASGWARGSRG